MRKFYYTPGPSELYFTVEKHMREALQKGIGSIHHRSDTFHEIYEQSVQNLRILFGLKEDFEVLFLNSATEIMERIIQNTVKQKSMHLVNGAFSERFYKTALKIGKDARLVESEWGDFPGIPDPNDQELIAATINETSTGVTAPLQDLYDARDKNPEALLAVDVVSSAPYDVLDFDRIDMAFLSVQKCFGLPPGLGVLLVNTRAIQKANEVHDYNPELPGFHSFPKLVENARKRETTETPNSLGIYLLSKVTEDMITKGMDQIRREINYKAAVLYQAMEASPLLEPFVKELSLRSKTVIVGKTEAQDRILEHLNQKGILAGKGYGRFKKEHIRFANFPTHSKEQVEQIADYIMELK